MNAIHLAQSAYKQNAQPIRTDRGTEYDAFAGITRRLKSYGQQKGKDFAALAEALHDNRRLWNILATSVADKQNSLPNSLRAQIFYLAEFTEQHTSKVLSGNDEVDVLVDVNLSIMRGLKPSVHKS